MINVLVVEDSILDAELLIHHLTSDSEINVIGRAGTGLEAIDFISKKRPDVITMDINIPGIDGLETTRMIMEKYPTPILIVSGIYSQNDVDLSFRAMDAGALMILAKPSGFGNTDYEKQKRELISTVKLISEIKVVSRRVRRRTDNGNNMAFNGIDKREISVIAIGASTGGPPVVSEILKGLAGIKLPPLLVVQHITAGFTKGFAEWLSTTTGMKVTVPHGSESAEPGTVYVAPDDLHMGISERGIITLSSEPKIKNIRPSVSHLFRSVAESFGRNSIGILLTGMGDDGSHELKLMKERGAVTIAQDAESSVVNGMPGEAVKLGGATYVLTPEKIVKKIKDLIV